MEVRTDRQTDRLGDRRQIQAGNKIRRAMWKSGQTDRQTDRQTGGRYRQETRSEEQCGSQDRQTDRQTDRQEADTGRKQDQKSNVKVRTDRQTDRLGDRQEGRYGQETRPEEQCGSKDRQTDRLGDRQATTTVTCCVPNGRACSSAEAYWIGSNDRRWESDFYWADGAKVSFTSESCRRRLSSSFCPRRP